MSSNWNVYKLFKSGKRAKAPIYTFTYKGDQADATTQFDQFEIDHLIEEHGERIKKFDFKIVDAESAQERIEVTDEQRYVKARNQVLATIIQKKKINSKRSIGGGLIYSKKTNWKWQWAALEAATNNYIEGLSDMFESHGEAIRWMNDKINIE